MQKEQELNKLLARYLENEDEREQQRLPYGPEIDDEQQYGFDERKRSMFRERGDGKYTFP